MGVHGSSDANPWTSQSNNVIATPAKVLPTIGIPNRTVDLHLHGASLLRGLAKEVALSCKDEQTLRHSGLELD